MVSALCTGMRREQHITKAEENSMNAITKTTKNDGEYRVRLFVDGNYQAGSDYFTDCKIDAKETAKAMVDNCTSDTTKEENVDDDTECS